MLALYNVISLIGLFLYLPVLIAKKGPADRLNYIKERLGMGEYSKIDIWVHAVSVGETLACVPFLKKLKKEFPERKILLTTTTYTGQKIARKTFPEADRIMYIPLDSFLTVNRAVRQLKPAVFAAVETELWPALFHALNQSGSRIVILNGRISDRSFRGYGKIGFLTRHILSMADFFYMQEKVYADRILSLGAEQHKVGIMGNFKFDISFDSSETLSWLESVTGSTFLAASTHRGEEEIILDAYERAERTIKDLRLIIAPRHPERFSEVADLMEKRGLKYLRRSELDTTLPAAPSSAIILLDTMGELSQVFSRASIAFVGGSLVASGGHNILEPAYWSKPIIFGPHMENFPIAEEFLQRSAALRVKDARDMAAAVIQLLTDQERAAHMGLSAKAIVDGNTGAVRKALELLRGYLGTA